MILFKAPSLILFGLIIGGLVYFSIPDNNKMGMYYFNSYQYETAYKYLNSANNFENGDIEALKRIKDYFLINGNTIKALNIQYKLMQLRPHNIGYHLEAEKLCDWNKRPIEKLMVMEKRAMLLDSDKREALFIEIAEGYRWLKIYKEATRVYQKLKNSNDKVILESAINYYLTKKEPKAAIEVLERFVDLYPDDDKYGTFLIQSYSYVGQKEKAFWQTLVQMGLPPALIKGDFASWLKGLAPQEIRSNWRSHSRLIYLSQEITSFNWRETLVSIYSEKLSGDTLVAFTIGESYFFIKKFKLAYEYFRMSEKRPENYRERNQQLINYYNDMNRPKDSIRCLKRLVSRFPRNQIYWESLGDTYEKIGAKKQALKAYMRLLRLESSSYDFQMSKDLLNQELYVQALGPITIPIKYKSARAKKKQRLTRRRVKDKVLAVTEDLKDPLDRITVYKELLNRSPNELRLLKRLGFTYFDIGEIAKAQKVFERIFTINPNDTDALEIIAGVKTEEGEAAETLELLKKLEKKGELSIYALGLRENALYALDESEEHKQMCAEIMNSSRHEKDFLVLKNRCLSRFKKKKEALSLQQSLVKQYPEDNDLLLQKAFSELDAGNLEVAQRDIELLRSRSIRSKVLSKYLSELEKIVKQRDSLVLFSNNLYLKAEDFSYLDVTQDLRKRVQSLGFGVSLRSFKLLSGGDSSFQWVSPYISLFRGQNFDASLGYRFGFGDKNFKSGLFAEANYYGRHSFFNATFENSEALVLTRNLVLEKQARSRTLSLYWEKFFSRRRDLFLFTTVLRWATFQQETGQARQITGEYLYSLMPKHKLIDFYAGAQLSRNTLSSDGFNLNQNFLPDSLSYHLVLRAQYGYQSEDRKHWRYLARIASGGDSKRGIGFAKSWQLRAEAARFYGALRNVRFYSEYYNETVGVNLGSTFLLGVNWTHRF
jgi:tetratricopeptide (TPR) repeat protein